MTSLFPLSTTFHQHKNFKKSQNGSKVLGKFPVNNVLYFRYFENINGMKSFLFTMLKKLKSNPL